MPQADNQTRFLRPARRGLAGTIVAITGSLWRARQNKIITTYGSARWASTEELKSAKLFSGRGVFLGKLGSDYLRHDGPEHVLAFAPTRSGKGVGLVIPTLLTWPHSAIVHDIKGENWQLTAGFRSSFSHCLLFNPADLKSARYNPLLEVRKGEWEVRDVQNIADILVDPEGALERRNHWEKTSHALLVGVILHVLYAEAEKTLTDAGFNILLSMETYKWYYHVISAERADDEPAFPYKLAGPLCDGGDVYFDIEGEGRLPDYRLLPPNLKPGDLLALLNCGAGIRSRRWTTNLLKIMHRRF